MEEIVKKIVSRSGKPGAGALGLETQLEVESGEPPEKIRHLIKDGWADLLHASVAHQSRAGKDLGHIERRAARFVGTGYSFALPGSTSIQNSKFERKRYKMDYLCNAKSSVLG